MNWPAIGVRFRASAIAAVAGWAAAMVVTVPMQFYEIHENASGGWRPLVWSLCAGTIIWLLWTLAITGAGWLLGGLPAIAIVREDWLLSHPRSVVAIAAFTGWMIVVIEFKTWQIFTPDHSLKVWLFTLYSLLLSIFAGVTAGVYLRRMARYRLSNSMGASGGEGPAVAVNLS